MYLVCISRLSLIIEKNITSIKGKNLRLLIGGSSSFFFHLKEFSDTLNKLGVESKLVFDADYADGFPSRKISNWFQTSKKFTKLIDRFNRVDEHFFDSDDHSMNHMKHKISEYYKSFDKERFTNTPKNSRHALEKFQHFKESFWNIFKD